MSTQSRRVMARKMWRTLYAHTVLSVRVWSDGNEYGYHVRHFLPALRECTSLLGGETGRLATQAVQRLALLAHLEGLLDAKE